MKNLFDVKNDLYNYIKKYNELVSEKESLIANNYIYEEVLTDLANVISGDYSELLSISICLETLFGNKYRELQDNIFVLKRLRMINVDDEDEIKSLTSKIITAINEIKNEYLKNKVKLEEIESELELKKEKMISSRRIQTCLKYKQVISKSDIIILNDLLREIDYSNDNVALIIENIFARNKSIVAGNTGIRFNASEKYKFINLLSIGGEIFTYPRVDDRAKLDKFAESIYNILNNYSDTLLDKNLIDFLPVVGKEIKDLRELEFILISVLDKIRSSFDEEINLIKDPDFIMDLEIKNELASECYKLIEDYNLIRNYLDDVVYESLGDDVLEEEKEEISNLGEKNNLFYLSSESGNCYLMSDVEKMPFEFLEKVSMLINGFKNNSLSNKKQKKMVENIYARGFSELKSDQVRIIYKRLNDNNYLIYGAFLKKDPKKYRAIFDNIVARTGIVCDDSDKVEEELMKYISKNARKWSR